MKHVETIQAFIKTLMNSETFHALVVQSPPGWGKSTTIDLALAELALDAVIAGSYATPLHIYNTLCRNPDSIIVLDDCAGVFSDPKAMAILKAATWQSSGQGATPLKSRRVTWGSTSDKVEQPSVDFSGKLILLTNMVSAGKETEAFLSRCLSYQIHIDDEETKRMLLVAAASPTHFENSDLALEVARFLMDGSTRVEMAKVNFRTLKMGYELATTHPLAWRELFIHLLPRKSNTSDVISQIFQGGFSVREQEAKFVNLTGKSRRTFFNYKKKMGLTRAYGNVDRE
ncbi:hypothetical protein WDW37_13760 [Bdellovibrionota bacterium FG-1]